MACVGGAVPDAVAHLMVGAGQVVHQGEQHADSMLAHGVAVAFGRTVQPDAALLAGLAVDVFHARAGPGDEAQLRCPIQYLGVDHQAAAHHQAFRVTELGQQTFAGAVTEVLAGMPSHREARAEHGVHVVYKVDLHARICRRNIEAILK